MSCQFLLLKIKRNKQVVGVFVMKDITTQQRRPNTAEGTIFNFLYCRLAKALLARASKTKFKKLLAQKKITIQQEISMVTQRAFQRKKNKLRGKTKTQPLTERGTKGKSKVAYSNAKKGYLQSKRTVLIHTSY